MAAHPDSNQGFPVRVFATRKDAVNVAVKAIAIATGRLANLGGDAEQIDIVAIPFFRGNRNAVGLQVVELNDEVKANAILTTTTSEFNVGGKTVIGTAAGAIAGSARNEEAVSLQAIGSVAVFNAIRSVAVAREYLEQKDDNIDLFVKVEFKDVRLDGREEDTSAVKITCFLYKGRFDILEIDDN